MLKYSVTIVIAKILNLKNHLRKCVGPRPYQLLPVARRYEVKDRFNHIKSYKFYYYVMCLMRRLMKKTQIAKCIAGSNKSTEI